MNDVQPVHNDICRLDYLIGTLATAYRGTLASLVVRDFCMNDDGTAVQFTGTVLSMPPGDYEASLNQSGVEVARNALRAGQFELRADSKRFATARELQIDILQSGRHIGTFLLKKEHGDRIYVSAVELSKELAGIDLTRLTAPLRGKPGLLQRAEEIVAQIHSTKKNWPVFSEQLFGLSIDMFWSMQEAFYQSFDLLVRFLLLAAERAGAAEKAKPAANFFDLLYLPLMHSGDVPRLRRAAETWAISLSQSSLEFSHEAERGIAVFRELLNKFPDVDLKDVVRMFILSLRNRISSRVFLERRKLLSLVGLLSQDDAEALNRFGEQGKDRMLRQLDDAGEQLDSGDVGRSLEYISGIDRDGLDDRKMTAALFDIMEKKLTRRTADPFAGVALFLISSALRLSAGAVQIMQISIPRIFERLIGLGRHDICRDLLRGISAAGSPLTEQIMLDPEIARSVLKSGRTPLYGLYESELKKIIIPAARVQGISADTWAEIVNPLHLERLKKFMDLLMAGDARLQSLLVRVIANLAAGGVLIPDDRLYQRRISAYLNSPAMHREFLLNYLLLERLPVYFNEVGATSRIRDYSTEIDSWGNDPVIYFIRKQIHVNASSNNIHLLESALTSWVRSDLSILKDVVPPDIYQHANPGLIERYSAVAREFFAGAGVMDAQGLHLHKLLSMTDETIDARMEQKGDDKEARAKVRLLCKLYKEIVGKYALRNRDVAPGNVQTRLADVISALRGFKSIVLAPEKTEPQESLYFKRHIAFGIPSVLGTYHEPKFDALLAMMRHGDEIPALLEELIAEVEQKEFAVLETRLHAWTDSLAAAWEILKVYGMQNVLVDEFAAILNAVRLSRAQTADVLSMWHKELTWMVASLSRTFHDAIAEIVRAFPHDDLPGRLTALGPSDPDFAHKAADVIMRDILSSIPGLVESDRLLGAIVTALRSGAPAGDENNESEQELTPEGRSFYDLHAVPRQDAAKLAPVLGSKAKNLIYLASRGLIIPAGAVLPARHAADLRYADQPDFLQVLREAVRAIERRTGAEFGGTGKPLFLSVRSGSYPSLPGILSSILYCGLNEQTLEAFIRNTGDPVLGWDSYRRFIEHYGTAVFGLDAGFFQDIVPDSRNTHPSAAGGCQEATHPKAIAGLYLERMRAVGLAIPQDVYEQLRQCVRAVYGSWRSRRAEQFRSATGTSTHWGTSVTLMEMVSGNHQGAGVSMFYTRNPATLEQVVYGETRKCASGDDLASGKRPGQPLSRSQEPSGKKSLEDLDPELYQSHHDLARTIEDAFGGLPQEVEVTYRNDAAGHPALFVLQARRMEQGAPSLKKFDELCRMESRVIGRGIGASGGALSGIASFADSPDQVDAATNKYGGPIILLRETASTDDVPLMTGIGGIITAAGGVTSHAVVLAQKFGITAVVGCAGMKVEADEEGSYALIGSTLVREGSAISIDGTTGLVFHGTCFRTADGGRPVMKAARR